MFCKFCSNLSITSLIEVAEIEFSNWYFSHTSYYQHHASYAELLNSASSGCELCALLCYGFKHQVISEFPWEGEMWESTILDIVEEGKDSSIKLAIAAEHLYSDESIDNVQLFDTILVQVGDAERIDEDYDSDRYWAIPPLRLGLSLPRGQKKYIGKYRIGRQKLDPDLGSDINHEIAKVWLAGCSKSHKNCPSKSVVELPARVIDVGPSDGSVEPRLFLTRGMEDRYVALSHCWGGIISPLLTTENLEAFQESIPFSTLPANFRDAVVITRKLGLRYVWIDSLCIIQNSKLDWDIESKKMGSIYRESYVTISAAVARSSTVGILNTVQKPILINAPAPVKIRLSDDPDDAVDLEIRDGTEESLRDISMRSPLNTRGWTLQETILSPRILHYGSDQIHWQCPSGFQSADGVPPGNRMPEDQKYPAISQLLYSHLHTADPHDSLPSSIESLREEYYTLVQEYTMRILSFPSDKLPAFSGLAQLLHQPIGGTYLAGLWSTDIQHGLLWYGGKGQVKHILPYRAPSWSWAVTDDEVLFHPMERKPKLGVYDVRLLECHVSCASNPYGQVTSGFLRLEGFTKVLVRSEQVMDVYIPPNDSGYVHFDEYEISTSSLFRVDDGEDEYLLSVIGSKGENRDWEEEIDSELFAEEEYLVLLVDVHSEEWEDGRSVEEGVGVVLRRVSGSEEESGEQETFERFGFVTLKAMRKEKFEKWIKSWRRETVLVV